MKKRMAMTHPQQPYGQLYPNENQHDPSSQETAKESRRYSLGTLVTACLLSALLSMGALIAAAYIYDSGEPEPATQYAYGTQDWLIGIGAGKMSVNDGTMRRVADVSCGVIEDNPDLDLPQQRRMAEDAIMEAVPGMDPQKATAMFVTGTATGCPHLVDSVAVTGLQMTLHGME